MSRITYLTPDHAALAEVTAGIKASLTDKGIEPANMPKVIIDTFFRNAARLSSRDIDFWLGFGSYLPAVEWIIAQQSGESEEEFYTRTQYPKNVVEAYSVPDDDLATLAAADLYMQFHRATTPVATTVWPLNEEEGQYIDLAQFEARLTGTSRI